MITHIFYSYQTQCCCFVFAILATLHHKSGEVHWNLIIFCQSSIDCLDCHSLLSHIPHTFVIYTTICHFNTLLTNLSWVFYCPMSVPCPDISNVCHYCSDSRSLKFLLYYFVTLYNLFNHYAEYVYFRTLVILSHNSVTIFLNAPQNCRSFSIS